MENSIADEERKENKKGEVETFEDLLFKVGGSGRINYLLLLMCWWCGIISPFAIMSAQFLGITPDHWCLVAPLIEANWTQEEIKRFAIPLKNNDTYDACLYYDLAFEKAVELGFESSMVNRDALFRGQGNATKECHSRVFDPLAPQTVTTQWDLVCNRLPWYSSTQSVGQVGFLIGSLVFGYLIDRYGRKKIIVVCTMTYLVCGLLTSAMPFFFLYMFFRLVISTLAYGVLLGGFVIGLEFCTTSQRSTYGSLYTIPWALGYMSATCIAYLVRPWYWLQIALTLPAITFVPYYWLLPESPRWLLIHGRSEEAAATLATIATWNGKEPPTADDVTRLTRRLGRPGARDNARVLLSCREKASKVLGTGSSLLRQREFRLTTINIFVGWLAAAFVYYGVALSSTQIGANVYMYNFFGALLEIPSYLSLWLLLCHFGRKRPLIAFYLVCASSIFLVMALRIVFGEGAPVSAMVVLSLAGKVAITAAFQLVYIITAEIYPTQYRSLAIGGGSFCGRIGSGTSPFINDLLGKSNKWAPSALFGGFSLLGGILAFFLPEMGHVELKDVSQLVESGNSDSID